jgi:hypothetical protein
MRGWHRYTARMLQIPLAAAGLAELTPEEEREFVRDVFGVDLIVQLGWGLALLAGVVVAVTLLLLFLRAKREERDSFE